MFVEIGCIEHRHQSLRGRAFTDERHSIRFGAVPFVEQARLFCIGIGSGVLCTILSEGRPAYYRSLNH